MLHNSLYIQKLKQMEIYKIDMIILRRYIKRRENEKRKKEIEK